MSEQKKETKEAEKQNMSKVKLDKRLLNLGKREIARRLTESNQTAHNWINACIMIASELYLRCPSHKVFSDGTFAESTADMILKEAAKKVKDLNFDRIFYQTRESKGGKFVEEQFKITEEINKEELIREFQMLRYRMGLDKLEDPDIHACDYCQLEVQECPATFADQLYGKDTSRSVGKERTDNIVMCNKFIPDPEKMKNKPVSSTPADKGESESKEDEIQV